MSDQSIPPSVPTKSGALPAANGEASAEAEKKARKKNKVRSAWISFVGRIVAQFIGAAATIGLGLVVLQKYHQSVFGMGAALPAIVGTGGEAPLPARERPANGEAVVAVLPLEDYSPGPSPNHLAEGLTDAVITALASADQLRVISRTSSMQYRSPEQPLPAIGRTLGADLIVEGSVTRVGDRIRVTAQLIEVDSDEHLWASTYERAFDDVLAVRTEIAELIARDVSEAWRQAAAALREAGEDVRDQWQASPPLSRNVAPSTGTNSQR